MPADTLPQANAVPNGNVHGISIGPLPSAASLPASDQLAALTARLGLRASDVLLHASACGKLHIQLQLSLAPAQALAWVPNAETLGLAQRLDHALGPVVEAELGSGAEAGTAATQREALVAMLAGPVAYTFPTVDELVSALRMRAFICRSASRTAMDFHTAKVDRPMAHWAYDEDRGFTLREGCDLIEAMRLTTQPDVSGRLYAFSCYRATEYILLLAIAKELRLSHAGLLQALESQWRTQAIASGRFHDTFLHEFGTNEAPLPLHYYVPGDRVWFRNPDEASSDVSGYEGSWTIYMGSGLFANMWKRNQPFTLQTKCVEIFHWRDAVYRDGEGEPRIDEAVVERKVRATLANAQRTAEVVERMLRLRDLQGVYADGGCIDRTREAPRWVRPGTTDIPIKAIETAAAPQERRGRRTARPTAAHQREAARPAGASGMPLG